MSEKFIKLHWSDTGVPRWINARHVIWFSPPRKLSEANADVFVLGDGELTVDYLGVKESPEEVLEMLTSSDQASGPSDDTGPE